jgi:uncharacterized membrane protein YqjE
MLRAKNQSKITRFSNAGLIMFRRVHEVRSILEFLRERAPHYGPLARDDLHKFRDEIVKASVGASISAAAGLIFACFLSVAVIVSAWDGLHRTAVAWTVCCGWGVVALGGLWYARKAISGPPPFQLMAAELARDYRSLLAVVDRQES